MSGFREGETKRTPALLSWASQLYRKKVCFRRRLSSPSNANDSSLAYVEMRLILARLVWNYDLVLADEVSERFPECKSFNLWLKGPLNVRLTPVARG
jgi:hypothetical protein